METYQEHIAMLDDAQRERFLNANAGNKLKWRDVVALNEKEAAGAARTTFKPNNIHNLKDEHFRRELGDYMVDESSLFVFHVFQESRGFHPLTGEKQTRAMAQMYSPEVFKMMKESRGFEGMQVYVAHDPTQPLTEEQRAFAVEKGWVKS